jgi:hypothetical protein
MEQDQSRAAAGVQAGILGAYLKRGLAVLVGAAIAIGLFFYFSQTKAGEQALQQATTLCVCSQCGAMIEKPPGLDCEEINCPGCGGPMGVGAMLAAAGEAATAPPSHAQAVAAVERPRPPRMPSAAPQPEGALCACPNCGKTIQRQRGVDCSHVTCPNCQSFMTSPVYVGKAAPTKKAGEMKLAGMAGGTGLGHAQNHHPAVGGAVAVPCPGPHVGGSGLGLHQAPVTAGVPVNNVGGASVAVTYTNTIKPIVEKNCYRCHSGQLRNLTTYENVKPYVDNGLLLMMVQPGGPMSRFVSASELHMIDSWVKAGAPR